MVKISKNLKIIICFTIILLIYINGTAQEITIIPNGVFKNGIKAIVTGDYVRVRKGPSLNEKIITKVNSGTEVYILERDKKLVKIDKYSNYWYKIKIKSTGKIGWMYGAFLKPVPQKKISKKVIMPKKYKSKPIKETNEYLGLIKIGEIKNSIYSNLITYGDLNSDGKDEIIIAQKSDTNSNRYSIAGYESNGNSYKKIYSLPVNLRNIKNISLINKKDIPFKILVVTDDRFSQLYIFDPKRKILRAIYRIDSGFVTITKVKDKGLFLVYTKQNPYTDYDSTVTYYIVLSSIKIRGKRLSNTGLRIRFHRPLPIKKLITFDINQDGTDEIVLEIGGQNHGGGIVVLSISENSIKQIINTGIPTYNSMPFLKLWGTIFNGSPAIAVYSTNPRNSVDVNTEFGLLLFSFTSKTLVNETFYRINKMLDDINNYRIVVPLPSDKADGVFLIMDYDKKSSTYLIKKPVF